MGSSAFLSFVLDFSVFSTIVFPPATFCNVVASSLFCGSHTVDGVRRKAYWDKGAAELFKLRCMRVCRFHLYTVTIFKNPFSSLLFLKQNIPLRHPSHHPRLYNVIRVHICSIQPMSLAMFVREKRPSGDVIKTDERFFLFPYIFLLWGAIFSL